MDYLIWSIERHDGWCPVQVCWVGGLIVINSAILWMTEEAVIFCLKSKGWVWLEHQSLLNFLQVGNNTFSQSGTFLFLFFILVNPSASISPSTLMVALWNRYDYSYFADEKTDAQRVRGLLPGLQLLWGRALGLGAVGILSKQMQAHHLGAGGHVWSSWPQAEMMQSQFQVIAVGELSN